jgi:hypothetical protein
VITSFVVRVDDLSLPGDDDVAVLQHHDGAAAFAPVF